jgi:hypothetical protein
VRIQQEVIRRAALAGAVHSRKAFMQEHDATTIDHLNSVTTQYVQALAGHSGESGRAAGLIVSPADVQAVRSYVAWALELPSGLDQIRQLLGYEEADIAGLEPLDIQSLYQMVQCHAGTWSGLEIGIKGVGTDLVYFSDALKHSGETLISFVEGLEGFRNAVGVTGDLTPETVERIPSLELTVRDRSRGATLEALVEDLRIVIADCSRGTAKVNADLSAFKRELKTRISPGLGLKMTLIRRNSKDLKLAQLNAELDALNGEIQNRSDSFEDFLQQQWALVSFTQALFVPEAPAPLRTDLESLLSRKRAVVAQIRQHHALLASLAELQTTLQDLRVIVDAAALAASNLENLWILVQTYIDGSAKRLRDMADTTFLVVFVARLRSMILAWADVKRLSADMLVAFDSAISQVRA